VTPCAAVASPSAGLARRGHACGSADGGPGCSVPVGLRAAVASRCCAHALDQSGGRRRQARALAALVEAELARRASLPAAGALGPLVAQSGPLVAQADKGVFQSRPADLKGLLNRSFCTDM